MLIATRFGIGIKDLSWFEHRLDLISAITIPSLLHQDDQSFEWALFVDRDLSREVSDRLREIISPFEGRAFLCSMRHAGRSMGELAESRQLVDSDGYLFTGRIDDDDAWATHTIREVRDRIGRWRQRTNRAAGYGFTFEDGLIWIMYDMLDVDQLQKRGIKIERVASIRPYKYPFTSISGFTYTPLQSGLTCISGGHATIPRLMTKQGYTVEYGRSEEPMWLYCRHKQTDSPIYRNQFPAVPKTLNELSRQFGIDLQRTAAYITSANKYGYTKVLRKFTGRRELVIALREITAALKSTNQGAEERCELLEKKHELEGKLSKLRHEIVEQPDSVLPKQTQRGFQ